MSRSSVLLYLFLSQIPIEPLGCARDFAWHWGHRSDSVDKVPCPLGAYLPAGDRRPAHSGVCKSTEGEGGGQVLGT